MIIVGGGGHALSIAAAARARGETVLGFVAPAADPKTSRRLDWLGDDDVLTQAATRDVWLLNGIGSAGPVARRRRVYLALRQQGQRFAPLRHPAACVCSLDVQMGDAVQVLARATINAGARIADNVLINTAATVEHGCAIGDHSHVATGAVVCGDCEIGGSVHVGAGATLIQGIRVGDGAVIAAGAVVTRDVEPLTLVAGVPARLVRRIDE